MVAMAGTATGVATVTGRTRAQLRGTATGHPSVIGWMTVTSGVTSSSPPVRDRQASRGQRISFGRFRGSG